MTTGPMPFGNAVTLDALFRRNAASRPAALAVSESGAHRPGGKARSLNYAELDNAASHLAAQLQAFRLPKDATVALHLPNGCELTIALLGVMRAGFTALPLPVLWRQSDLIRALREAETSVLITTSNFTLENLPMLAGEVAGEVFELSFPCAFGNDLPDGIIPLSVSTEPLEEDVPPAQARITTLGISDSGIAIRSRNDAELLASGLGVLIAGDMRANDTILAAVSLASIAGLGGAFVPWLLTGGTLHLLDDLPATTVVAPDQRRHAVAPARALEAICATLRAPIGAAIAVHQDGGADGYVFRDIAAERVVDFHIFNEVAAIAIKRASRSTSASIPIGAVHAGSAAADAPVVVETKLDADMRLFVRGPMVPALDGGHDQWTATGFTGIILDRKNFKPDTPDNFIVIGGLRFSIADLEQRINTASPGARVAMIEDPLLGTRLAIWAEDSAKATDALLAAGLPRIVASSVLRSEPVRAAS